MLTESFVASILSPEKAASNAISKDAGIHLYDYRPLPALRSSFKKSSTGPNCLAVTTSHVFAAQADKAVVHVYNRDRGNQEAVVPFPEKICSVAYTGDLDGAGVLLLGTEGGRIILWELCTGRQVSTPQSHLQPATCLAGDPTSNFLLSGSSDSNIHVWSIPALLSFSIHSAHDSTQPSPYSPLRTLSNHRAAITALVLGHSHSTVNIAVSGSQDNTCIVWDYQTGSLLHTFLLPSAPLCLAIDPADRAVYAGFEDGSIQLVDFYKQSSLTHALYDPALRSTPTQPPPSDRWLLPSEASSSVLSLDVSYDGTALLSGHQNGIIQTWDIAKGRYNKQLTDFSSPATNLLILPPTGFPNTHVPNLKVHNVVKPRYESSLQGSNAASTGNMAPENYTFVAQFTSTLPLAQFSPKGSSNQPLSDFQATLTHPSFPLSLLEEGIAELSTFSAPKSSSTLTRPLDGNTDDKDPELANLHLEIHNLRAQVNHAQAVQIASTERALKLSDELARRNAEEKVKKMAKKKRRLRRMRVEEVKRKRYMGEKLGSGDEEMEEGKAEGEGEEESLSSSTDELTPSD